MACTKSNTVVAFPKSKKRGPKVRTGQSAAIITLPTRDHALAALSEASSGIEQLLAIMSLVERKYGTNRPPANVIVNELCSGVTP